MSTETELTAAREAVAANTLPQNHASFPKITARRLAWNDLLLGLKKWPVWIMLAYQDIKLRYRRSVLGPFWITLSMAITVYSMGYLYGHLFHIELDRYYPFLVAGMLAWSLISVIITELTDALTLPDSVGMIKHIKLPYTLYIHRIAAKNFIIFFHNIFVIVPVLIIFSTYAKINFNTLLLIPGLLVIYVNAIAYGLILGIIGARYRDVSQIIRSFITVVFFITPVLWSPEILGARYSYAVDLNPFYALIEIIRAPLLGSVPTLKNIGYVTFITLLGITVSSLLFTRYRQRIVYWI